MGARRGGVLYAAGTKEGAAVIRDLGVGSAGGLHELGAGRWLSLEELKDPGSGRMPERSHLLGWHEFSSLYWVQLTEN